MKSAKLLDSFAVVKYILAEPGGDRVLGFISEARRSEQPLLLSEINAGEVFYVIAKRFGLAKAEEVLTLFSTLPIRMVPVSWELILQAARLKAQFALSYAECIAADCAMAHQAVLVTGDKEFRSIQHLVRVEWI